AQRMEARILLGQAAERGACLDRVERHEQALPGADEGGEEDDRECRAHLRKQRRKPEGGRRKQSMKRERASFAFLLSPFASISHRPRRPPARASVAWEDGGWRGGCPTRA